jgi:archaellum biogenesis ATPase FlaH
MSSARIHTNADELIEKAHRMKEEKRKHNVFSIRDIPDVSTLPRQHLEYAVEGLILKSAITMVTGEPACGKSTWLTAMAHAISLGIRFCGLGTQKSPVLILDRENTLPVVQDRLDRISVQTNPSLLYWGSWVAERPCELDSATLLEYVDQQPVKPVIIIDSFNAFHIGDENDAEATRNYLRPVRALANAGAAVILIHHNGKSETSKQYRGSSAILGEIDAGLLISNKSDRPGLGVLEVKPFKARVLGQGIPKFRYMHRRGFEADYGAGAPTSSHEEQLTELLRHNAGIKKKAWQELAVRERGVTYKVAGEFLDAGVLSQRILRTGTEHRGYCHTLAEFAQNELYAA